MAVLTTLFISLAFPDVSLHAADDQLENSQSIDNTWTENDWIDWWNNFEDLYLSGVHEEGLYWLLRHDLEILGEYEDVLSQIEIPPPYDGWSGNNPGDPAPPQDPYSLKNGSGTVGIRPMYGEMPSEWEDLILQHGLNPADFGGIGSIPSPPMWLAASMVALGDLLQDAPHRGIRVVGKTLSRSGTVIIIWIEVEDEDIGDDNEGE